MIRSKNGETIVEIMISLLIILLAIITAFQILSSALQQSSLTENRIIAINLAHEGMEAVRYIRDYNWLYYSSYKRKCWNYLEDNNNNGIIYQDADRDGLYDLSATGELVKEDTECSELRDTANQIAAATCHMEYILKQNGSHWFLTSQGHNSTPITGNSWSLLNQNNIHTKEGNTFVSGQTQLGSSDTNYDIIESFRLCRNNENSLYVSCLNESPANENLISDANPLEISKFFRYVKILYEDGSSAPGDTDNKITAVVGVKWVENNILQDVELITKFSDFYERLPEDGTI